MPTLAVLAFATPVFGFALTPPAPIAASPPPNSLVQTPVFAQLDDEEEDDEDRGRDRDRDRDRDDEEEDEASDSGRSRSGGAQDMQAYAAQLRQRQQIGTIHRAFGIATWASMLVTVVLGYIQYNNLYGFFGSREDTPCVQGTAVFGQDQCWGTPWPHRISSFATTALYSATFLLSFVMPDPDNAEQGNSAYANNLRIHKALRWVHLGGMILQVVLGLASANNWFGIDRANDFGAQQALATVHQVIGLATFGTMTAAGAIMIF